MSMISVGGTAFIKAQPQEVIEQQKRNTESSITTMLTDIPPSVPQFLQQPGVKVWKASEIYAMVDVMGNQHQRPMSDSEYNYFIDILKRKGMTNDKMYYDYELYAIAVTVLVNMKAFHPEVDIDPIVENTINDIVQMPAVQGPNFSAQVDHYMSEKWFGQSIEDAQDKYSDEEKIRFGAKGIAFVEEYLADRDAKAESEKIIDATEDQRREIAATEAGSAIAMSMQAPSAQAMLQKAQAAAPKSFIQKVFTKAEPLSYEQAVHPMLRYGLVKRK